jgi:tetratricopeptide (TPR) repeat protein
LGNRDEAKKYYRQAIDEDAGESEYLYFKGLAYAKLGSKDKAAEAFKQLADLSKQPIQNANAFISFTRNESDDFYKAKKHFMAALASFGQGDNNLAKEELKKSLELNPVDLWANYYINNGFN